jgi:hypothetical protein
VIFSQNKPATSNQPAVLFSQTKSASAITSQQYFSLRPNQHQPSANSQTNRPLMWAARSASLASRVAAAAASRVAATPARSTRADVLMASRLGLGVIAPHMSYQTCSHESKKPVNLAVTPSWSTVPALILACAILGVVLFKVNQTGGNRSARFQFRSVWTARLKT